MKHKDLNDLGEKFLKTGYRFKYKCQVIVKELKSSSNEIPDVIGFYSGGSVIIESKTSKADFNRDKKKNHRNLGAGDYRFFLCEENLLSLDDLYDDWGLLYTDGTNVTVIKEPEHRGADRNRYQDCLIMYSIIRRTKNK
jgi:hypothetical protein